MHSRHFLILVACIGLNCGKGRAPAEPRTPGRSTALTAPAPSKSAPAPTPTAIRVDGGRVPPGYVEPVVVRYVQPKWPESTGLRRIRNSTFLFEALITQDGSIAELRTLRTIDVSPPYPELETVARNALLQSRYAPATLNGRPVPAWLTISLHLDFR